VESAWVCVNREMQKANVVYLHNGVLLSCEEG
jgi:hypothetical protein